MTQFQKFVDEMPHGKADEFRNKVVEACGITQSLFRLWRNGLNVQEKHHATINLIAADMFGKAVFTEQS